MNSEQVVSTVVGRRVVPGWYQPAGTIEQWEPFGAGLCDVLIRHDDGSVCWYALYALRPESGEPFPERAAVCRLRDAEMLEQLRTIRARHVAEMGARWPGAEHGKALIGRAIDGAISEVSRRLGKS